MVPVLVGMGHLHIQNGMTGKNLRLIFLQIEMICGVVLYSSVSSSGVLELAVGVGVRVVRPLGVAVERTGEHGPVERYVCASTLKKTNAKRLVSRHLFKF